MWLWGPRPDLPPSAHTLINPESVWPLEPDLQKSNQYVNSVISVRSITTPFTQKPERCAFQSRSPYLWHEIQIHYDEGEKHRRDAGWGLSSSYIFSMSIWRTCHPRCSLSPTFFFSPSLADNQLWKYFSVVKCPGATKATQLSPVGGRSQEPCALYLLYWQTSLNSTGCISPVKVSEYKPISPQGEGQQHNRVFLPGADWAPDSEHQPETYKCLQ